jgi:hypothetical protein
MPLKDAENVATSCDQSLITSARGRLVRRRKMPPMPTNASA